MVRHKRRRFASAAVLGVLFLAGGACTFEGMHQKEQRQKALTMAEYSADLLAQGDVTGAVGLLTEDRTAVPDDAQRKALSVAAAFLAKQMEE